MILTSDIAGPLVVALRSDKRLLAIAFLRRLSSSTDVNRFCVGDEDGDNGS